MSSPKSKGPAPAHSYPALSQEQRERLIELAEILPDIDDSRIWAGAADLLRNLATGGGEEP